MPKWDCSTCTLAQKKERGCTDKPVIPQEMDGEVLIRCPRRPMLDDPSLFQQYFKIYSWYKRGYLPDNGSYIDQAAAFVQLIEILEQAIADAKAIKEAAEKSRGSAPSRN